MIYGYVGLALYVLVATRLFFRKHYFSYFVADVFQAAIWPLWVIATALNPYTWANVYAKIVAWRVDKEVSHEIKIYEPSQGGVWADLNPDYLKDNPVTDSDGDVVSEITLTKEAI